MENLPYSVAPLPENEEERVQALKRYRILDTPPEEKFDGIIKAASLICGTPIALVSLIDSERQWFKARMGLAAPETPRQISFCQFAVYENKTIIVEDASIDPRFQQNPLVLADPNIRFYAGAPLRTPDGYVLGTLCVIDTKPKKLSSAEIQALEALANSVVSFMELDAKSQALIQLQSVALELQKAKEQFFINMNHELRTPVHGILGMVDLLNQTSNSELQKEYLDSLTESSEHLIRLINDVIDFSKAESGSLHFSFKEFDLISLLERYAEEASDKAFKKGLAFKTILPPARENIDVKSDSIRVRQILSNLVSNALKFTEKGGVTVELDIEKESETDITLSLSVKDTGIGIEADRIPTLFEAFSQTDISISRKYGGTGLGLSICKRVCEALDWNISVESEVGKGSKFTLELTLPKANLVEKIKIAESKNRIKFDFSDHKDLKILIAEDNLVNQRLIQKMLEKLGLNGSVVSNGIEALVYWEENDVDLLLLDIQMPELSGLEVARILKKKPSTRKVPWIIAVTAHDSAEDRKACAEAGMDDYLGKPFRIEDLGERIQEFLKFLPSSLAS
ncbi:hybrid sensor histidine kinase/response regulator [Leptospira haakeii]|uniref:histidine kinase n=1 Tax=Leptospira haakeii TaxID=2023198 RepID=A0ABX4PKZ2_9LEPT|nr:ATP-binding protein [Leptospira haakeii]PKA16006.1 hybrid sensor histidine kinase/response regulator [Leptospira haakeii]PKA19207.1 hybrid sensor histidine kinase/response regulator [Leptospira haakeii]